MGTSTTQAAASGPGLQRVPVGDSVEFYVNVLNSTTGELDTSAHQLTVEITDSRAEQLPVESIKEPKLNSFVIVYVPE